MKSVDICACTLLFSENLIIFLLRYLVFVFFNVVIFEKTIDHVCLYL